MPDSLSERCPRHELELCDGPDVGEVLGQVLGGVAHELANATFGIRSQIDLVLDTLDAGHPARVEIEQLEQVAERIASLSSALPRLRRTPRASNERTNVFDVVRPLIEAARAEGVRLEVDAQPSLPEVAVPAGELRHAFGALLSNAREAIGDGGSVTVRVHADGLGTLLRVEDDGAGMSDTLLARAVRPFVTTKSRAHLGLGFSVVRVVVARAGGRLRIASATGQGTEVALWLPRTL